jgi:histidine decarboxylase
MDKTEVDQFLKTTLRELEDARSTALGYPVNTNYDYSQLFPFLNFSLNNVGDPFQDCNYRIATRKVEREVVNFFADLYKLPDDDRWGYVTSGGTEGNLYGIYLGRERFPDSVLFASSNVHYSIPKIARLLRMPYKEIPSQENGELDYELLDKALGQLDGKVPIINVNIGTTVKGAIDDVDKINVILKTLNISRYHIHCDAALFGLILPFINSDKSVSFESGIDSIAISGHKFVGSPIISGVALTKKSLIGTFQNEIEYISSDDDTVLGSRSGLAPLILWYAIKTRGVAGFKKEALECMENARYLEKKLKEAKYPAMRNKGSNTVLLKLPSRKIVLKWQLATEGEWAHVVVMQQVSKEKIDEFLGELLG